jgi:hypothetical protein
MLHKYIDIRLVLLLVTLLALATAEKAHAQCNGGPCFLVGSPRAFVSITPTGGINASSYNNDSFIVRNDSLEGVNIRSVKIDLRGSILPDMVFDPAGTAGDVVAKCLQANTGAATVGFVAPANPCTSPFSSPHDSGFDVIELHFNDFDPGEEFRFSVDVDPTSIRGTSGQGGGSSGSVSGLEMTGALVTVTFDDNTVRTGELFRGPGSSSEGRNIIKNAAPSAPSISAVGIASPSNTTSSSHTIRVTGTPGASVRLLRVEAELDLNGGNGFDIDPFEANSALVVGESSATLSQGGTADINVTLTRTDADSGYNYFKAVVVDSDGSGRTSNTSNTVILRLIPQCAVNADCSDGNPCTNDTCSNGTCSHTNNSANCDDGVFCNGADTCSGGVCVHAGNPCAGGGECANTCNEATDSCHTPAGTACTDDGNVCTDDRCDGSGNCVHPPNAAPCDDGVFCNGADTCAGGTCSVHSGDPCPDPDHCDETGASCVACLIDAHCEDGNACTTGHTCEAGVCSPGGPVTCDDGSACNGLESCDPSAGCVAGSPFDCSAFDTDCAVGACQDDPFGCAATPANEGGPCDGLEACFVNPRCEDGACVGDPLCDSSCELCTQESACLSRCGHPVTDPGGPVRASDALVTLQAAVGGAECAPCICDVDANGQIVASDALTLLAKAVDATVEINCSQTPDTAPVSTTTSFTTTTSTVP